MKVKKVKRPKSAAPVLGAGAKREKVVPIPFRRTKENALQFRPRSANSPERAHDPHHREALQQHRTGASNTQEPPQQQAVGKSRLRPRSYDAGAPRNQFAPEKLSIAAFDEEGLGSGDLPRPKTANVKSPSMRGPDVENTRQRPSSAHMASSKPSRPSARPSATSWRRLYSPNQSRVIRPSSGLHSRPRSSTHTTRRISYDVGGHGSSGRPAPQQAYPEAQHRFNQLAVSPLDAAIPTAPGTAGMPPWLAQAKQFFQRRYLQSAMKATNENNYGQQDQNRVDASTFEDWHLQAQRLVQEAELLWQGNNHLAKELNKENVERVARVAKERSIEHELREELHRVKADLGVTQGSLEQMRDLATKAAAREAKATKKMEKTRATHDRLIRRLMYSGLDLEKILNMDADGNLARPDIDGSGNDQKRGRGPGGYLTSAKVKAASNLVRRENLKLKRENKEMRQELKVADSKVRRLWTRLHRVEGGSLKGVSLAPEGAMRGNESLGEGYSEDNPSLSGVGWHKPVRARGESQPAYALMAGMHTNANSRPFSRVAQAPRLNEMGGDGVRSIIPDAGSWNGQEVDIKGNDDETYDDDFEDANEDNRIGSEANLFLFNDSSVDGLISNYMTHAGLADFTDAILGLDREFTCLDDLFDREHLSDDVLISELGMDEDQVRAFWTSIETFEFEEPAGNQQQQLPIPLGLDSIDGGSGNIANLTAIAQFLTHHGLSEFTGAIFTFGGNLCLEDLCDARCLSDQQLLENIGMNEAQVRLFREAVAQVEGSAGRSTLPDDSDDSDNGNGGDDESNRRQDDLDDNLDAGASPSDYAEVDSLKARIAELESALSEKQDEIEGSLEERAELERALLERHETTEKGLVRIAELESALAEKPETVQEPKPRVETRRLMAHSPIKKVGPPLYHGTMGVSHLFIRNILKEATTNDPEPIESIVAHRGEEVPPASPVLRIPEREHVETFYGGGASENFVGTSFGEVDESEDGRGSADDDGDTRRLSTIARGFVDTVLSDAEVLQSETISHDQGGEKESKDEGSATEGLFAASVLPSRAGDVTVLSSYAGTGWDESTGDSDDEYSGEFSGDEGEAKSNADEGEEKDHA